MPDALDSINPGQTITVSVKKTPRRKDQVQTIERLMRQDVSARGALRRAHGRRSRTTRVKTRGGRRWYVRQHPAKVVRVEPGAEWTMAYIPHLAGDFKSVRDHLDIKAG